MVHRYASTWVIGLAYPCSNPKPQLCIAVHRPRTGAAANSSHGARDAPQLHGVSHDARAGSASASSGHVACARVMALESHSFAYCHSESHTLGALWSQICVAAHQAAKAALQRCAQAPDAVLKTLRLVDLHAGTQGLSTTGVRREAVPQALPIAEACTADGGAAAALAAPHMCCRHRGSQPTRSSSRLDPLLSQHYA